MIHFNCENCGKLFVMSAEYAGRKGKCKKCGAVLTIPSVSSSPPNAPAQTSESTNLLPSEPSPTVQPTPQPAANLAPKLPVEPPPARNPTSKKIVIELPTKAVAEVVDAVVASPEISSTLPTPANHSTPPSANFVPSASNSSKPRRYSVRNRRLQADYEHVCESFANSPLIDLIEAVGSPPELYRVRFHLDGLIKGNGEHPIKRSEHEVEIQLTRDYPRQSPHCKMLTPIFHPNIEPAMICVGDHWTAAERLADLIIRIGELITYQAYNIKSPLNGEAAMWADQNADRLPVDSRNLHATELD